MNATPITMTDREVINLIMTSDKVDSYTEEDRAVETAHRLAVMARYREDMKEWSRKAKLKARKQQGGRRDHWAELLKRAGPLRRGYEVTPDHLLSHKAKLRRTQVLKLSEERRKRRLPSQRA